VVGRASGHDSGLDLAEDETASVGGDDVQLAVTRAEVGVDDLEAACLQVRPSEPLAGRSQRAPRVGSPWVGSRHAGDATDGRVTRVRPM
jgi:hypothetical protein